ncbi:MAG: signal recognition particle-docking protein FtsY [Micavibrio aeruginosavorus]|uniref:Signal recognition particle receptor FtsY n=1 Tax=Micavibrio aeruginosavorus TaxID=349221 RepID=A0A7T5R1F0_9BACT|nr:MAG: signal recognition particle-docking protein FtsY [Micavibrio aeruginosavorus]
MFWRKDKKQDSQAAPVGVIEPVAEKHPEPSLPPREGDRPGETWLSRLGMGLSKSSTKLGQGIADLLTKRKLDQETLDGLEELLITADLGPQTAARVIADFSQDRFGKDLDDNEIKAALSESIARILEPVAVPLAFDRRDEGPFVVLVCGVNGAGKTTTIGKIAHNLQCEGKRVAIAAGDTFRAAAVEQLKVWAERTGSVFLAKDAGSDAAAVAFEAYEAAKRQGVDVLLVDTAGRLHNKSNLMAELQKVIRVLKKHNDNLPHATLLVLDSTTGQNAHAQVETFRDMVNVTGLVVTKLDGSAKGGVVIGLADRFALPIHLIGVGEGIEDLQPFKARDFSDSLVGLQR